MSKAPHRYTPKQLEFLAQHAAGRSTAELTELFNGHFGLDLKTSQIKSVKKNRKLRMDESKANRAVHHYTPEQNEFLARHSKGRSTAVLTELFNTHFGLDLKPSQIRSIRSRRGLKEEARSASVLRHEFTSEQIDFLAQHVVGRSSAELTELFNARFKLELKTSQIRSFKKNHKLSSGFDTRYKPGNVPVFKGKSLPSKPGSIPTQFKKGQKPYNYMPVGSERVNSEGYVDVKIADPNIWRQKHHIIWEEANGPIPEGHVLVFGDGNRLNVELDNLLLITQRQLSVLNVKGLIRDNIELTKAGLTVADLYLKIGERKRSIPKKKRGRPRREANTSIN